MSDEEQAEATPQMIAQYKDGQLQIVEVTPFKGVKEETHILPDLSSGDEQKYAVLDPTNGLVKLDLLNLRLVRCPNGEEQYQFVANDESGEGDINDETVTCVLQTSDNEDPDNQESYVMVDGEGEQGPLVFLQSSLQPANQSGIKVEEQEVQKQQLTPAEILEKAKALQKAKTLITQSSRNSNSRKRKSDLPPPHELLALPNFKLYLYSCKHCNFKCNAIREMSAHKASEHGSGSGGASKARGPWRGPANITLQCARCPYRGNTHSQLMKHVHEKHTTVKKNTVHLNTEEVEAADVLVCGACGFESSSRSDFRKHIEVEHGATTC